MGLSLTLEKSLCKIKIGNAIYSVVGEPEEGGGVAGKGWLVKEASAGGRMVEGSGGILGFGLLELLCSSALEKEAGGSGGPTVLKVGLRRIRRGPDPRWAVASGGGEEKAARQRLDGVVAKKVSVVALDGDGGGGGAEDVRDGGEQKARLTAVEEAYL